MVTIMLLPETAQEKTREINGKVVEHSNDSRLNIIEDPRIADPVFKHFTETSTTRELAKYSCINKAWKTLLLDNILVATSATHTRDSYFPLRFKSTCSKEGGWHAHKWTWSGVHHPSLEFHCLPHIPESIMGAQMDFRTKFPLQWECAVDEATYPASTLLAVAGGLMLFRDGKGHERPLTVYNPLTNESRELPKIPTYHKLSDDPAMRWHVLDMVADEKARSYKVILTFKDRVFVYLSTSNSWSLRRFPEEAPLAFESPAKAIVEGKLYFAELEINGEAIDEYDEDMQALAHVAVFEVDDDAGTWKQSMRVPLRDYFLATFDGFMDGSTDIALIECMGRLFAVIPALLDLHKTVEKESMEAERIIVEQAGMQTYNDYGYLPLQFYLLPLGGEGGVRQVLIQPPDSRNIFGISMLEDRRREALRLLETPMDNDWVHCHSHGSVISLTFEDYLVQYDMVSGRSQTFILPGLSSFDHEDFVSEYYENGVCNVYQMAYSPSFLMKP